MDLSKLKIGDLLEINSPRYYKMSFIGEFVGKQYYYAVLGPPQLITYQKFFCHGFIRNRCGFTDGEINLSNLSKFRRHQEYLYAIIESEIIRIL